MASHAFLSRCVDANSSGVKLIFCPEASVSGPWSYDEESQMLVHRRGNRCLNFSSDNEPLSPAACRCLAVRGDSLALMKCDAGEESHKWVFKDTKPSWAT